MKLWGKNEVVPPGIWGVLVQPVSNLTDFIRGEFLIQNLWMSSIARGQKLNNLDKVGQVSIFFEIITDSQQWI